MSEPVPSVLEAKDRALRYWESDGLQIIILGASFALMGLGQLYRTLSPPSDFSDVVGRAILWAGLFLLGEESTARCIVRWLKARITYPRTGYVAPPLQPPEEGSRLAAVLRILNLLFVFAVLGMILHQRWLFGVFAVSWLFMVWHFRNWGWVPWQQKYAPPIVGCGYAIFPSNWPATFWGGFTIAVGLIIVLAGLGTLLEYLKKHPRTQL